MTDNLKMESSKYILPSKYMKVAGPLVPLQLVAATSIVCLALYGRVRVVSLICEVVVIMVVPLMV